MLASTLLYFSLLSSTYAGIGPNANLIIANKYISPDGFNRSAVLAGSGPGNVGFPGPIISGTKGDTFNLNVIDDLTDPTMRRATSIHWHGIFQDGSSWADGPIGVTQCPISPGHQFMYTFSVPKQAGTFWYHSHLTTQYCDGLRGPLIIYDPDDPYKYMYDVDNDATVITLADWLHAPAPSLGVNPTFVSGLINGKGRYLGGPASPLSVIKVTQHKRYRFRIIAISCDPDFIFSIDGHTMTIIEVDGVNVQPLTVDSIDIFPGQRYSVVFKANQPIGNYWVRSQPTSGTTTFDGGLNSAILRYTGAPVADPTTLQIPNSNPMVETNLHPLSNPAAPGLPHAGGADVAINLDITWNATAQRYSINGATFIPPTVPVLLQILSGVHTAQELLPPGSVYSLPPNKVIEVTIPGGSADSPHPFHLHGHTFSVVRSAGSSTYNYVNPVKRDVVSTGVAGDNVTIRFVTDNSGPWFLHCHIEWHLDIGLAVVFAEDIPAISKSTHPPAWDQLCPTYDALNNSST